MIEKRLDGQEASILVLLVAGRTIVPLQSTQDHKQALDGDKGPGNTGGMGAYCPAPVVTPELWQEIETQILVPTVHAPPSRHLAAIPRLALCRHYDHQPGNARPGVQRPFWRIRKRSRC